MLTGAAGKPELEGNAYPSCRRRSHQNVGGLKSWRGRSDQSAGAKIGQVKDAGRPWTLENTGPWLSGP